MTTQVNPRDWEILSAYLDGELQDKQKKLLEDRVRVDNNLRSSLEALQRTRETLRNLPNERAPRNFTLSPEMAGVARRRESPASIFPMMRLASILATVFLVIISAGSLVANNLQPAVVPQSRVAQQPAFGMGGGGGGGGGPESSQSLLAPVEPGQDIQPTPGFDGMAEEALPVEPLPAGTELQLKSGIPTPTFHLPPEAMHESQLVDQDQQDKSVGMAISRSMVSFIFLLQVLLAVLAVATGAIAIYLRNSMR